MLLGVSKEIITPTKKVRLAGYAKRESVFEEVIEDIYLRVFWFKKTDDTDDKIIVYGDLIWFGEDFIEIAKKKIKKHYPKIDVNSIVFVASHNHSGPPTSHKFIESLETYDEEYANFLIDKLIICLKSATSNFEKVKIKRYKDTIDLNVYRRVFEDNVVKMKPNYKHSCNKDINIITFENENNKIKGIFVHYPCHANISSDNNIMPDFPGIVLRYLDQEFESSVSIYMQGATADIRPNIVLGNEFISLQYNYVVSFAKKLVDKILLLINKGLYETNEVSSIFQKNLTIELPLEPIKSNNDFNIYESLENDVKRQWALKIKENNYRLSENLNITILSFGTVLELVFFNSELSQEYERFLKEVIPHSLAVTYSNGMIGYISTKNQIIEGGYEPVESTFYFALNGKYKASVESTIKQILKNTLRGDIYE